MEIPVDIIKFGDCIESMQSWPDNIVQTCVTSPPYYGLRDYGHADQIGHEDTPAQYIAKLVNVFGQVKRLLKDDGTLWVNIGDSYATTQGGDYKPKDLIGIPWMLAFALRADGWYLRQDIIWHKPNAMPESVKDRCTKSHEYIFLMSKSEKYYYDKDSILEDAKWERWGDQTVIKEQQGTASWIGNKSKTDLQTLGKKNKRSVWTIPTKPYKGAHCAVYPTALIEPCILAGSKPHDLVLDPFMGSGTTAEVSVKLGRKYIGCELNPSYKPLQDARIASVQPTLSQDAIQLFNF